MRKKSVVAQPHSEIDNLVYDYKEPQAKRSMRIFLIIVLFLSFSLSLLFYYAVDLNTKNISDARLHVNMSNIENLIGRRGDVYLDALYGIKGLFAASQSVERNEFSEYIQADGILSMYPGVSSIVFVERVKDEEKEDFVNRVRSDTSVLPNGYPDFNIYPDSESEEYYATKYVEPFESKKLSFGFDHRSEMVRRESLEKARDTGLPQASPVLVSVVSGEKITAISIPIYENNVPQSTMEERRQALEGFVIVNLNYNEFLSAVLASYGGSENLDWSFYDGDIRSNTLVFTKLSASRNGSQTKDERESRTGAVDIASRRLIIIFTDPTGGAVRTGKILTNNYVDLWVDSKRANIIYPLFFGIFPAKGGQVSKKSLFLS